MNVIEVLKSKNMLTKRQSNDSITKQMILKLEGNSYYLRKLNN